MYIFCKMRANETDAYCSKTNMHATLGIEPTNSATENERPGHSTTVRPKGLYYVLMNSLKITYLLHSTLNNLAKNSNNIEDLIVMLIKYFSLKLIIYFCALLDNGLIIRPCLGVQ